MKITALKKLQKGFTLIELLVVIAVLGILAAAVMIAINPAAKLNSAKDANLKSDISQLTGALQSYYTGQNPTAPFYPVSLAGLVTASELKSLPKQQNQATACPAGYGSQPDYCYKTDNSNAIIFGAYSSSTGWWCWDSTSAISKLSTNNPSALTCP